MQLRPMSGDVQDRATNSCTRRMLHAPLMTTPAAPGHSNAFTQLDADQHLHTSDM